MSINIRILHELDHNDSSRGAAKKPSITNKFWQEKATMFTTGLILYHCLFSRVDCPICPQLPSLKTCPVLVVSLLIFTGGRTSKRSSHPSASALLISSLFLGHSGTLTLFERVLGTVQSAGVLGMVLFMGVLGMILFVGVRGMILFMELLGMILSMGALGMILLMGLLVGMILFMGVLRMILFMRLLRRIHRLGLLEMILMVRGVRVLRKMLWGEMGARPRLLLMLPSLTVICMGKGRECEGGGRGDWQYARDSFLS